MTDINMTNMLSDIEQIKIFFKRIIIDTTIDISEDTISWPNYQAGITKRLYAYEYESLKKKRQYSFLLSNNGFIQCYYNFEKKVLRKAKLAYYPYPVALQDGSMELEGYFDTTDDKVIGEYYYDLYQLIEASLGKKITADQVDQIHKIYKTIGGEMDEAEILAAFFDKKYTMTNSSHIRIDYDSTVLSHHNTEIQYSGINNIRLPLNKVISPFLFFDFIVRYEFPQEYQANRRKAGYKSAFSVAQQHSGNIPTFKENNIYLTHV